MLPRHSGGPCIQETASESGSTLDDFGQRVDVGLGDRVTDLPMYESWKLTLSLICTMAGTISFSRQALASGHLDMMCASRATFVAFFSIIAVSASGCGGLVVDDRPLR